MAQAPLDRPLARPTDAPPLAHEPAASAEVPDVVAPGRPGAALAADELPRHVAIIMDGNRRWARARGVSDFEGHAAGVEAIRGLLQHAVRRGVPMLTLYAFSRENWARSDDEVAGLFDLLGGAIANETDELGARASGSGCWAGSTSCPRHRASIAAGARPNRRRDAPPAQHRVELRRAAPSSSTRSGGSRASGIAPETIDERDDQRRAVHRRACRTRTSLIRTGGEQRLSNFLIWQSAYAELVFTDCLWPDFGPEAFDAALLEFARRTRRFGR